MGRFKVTWYRRISIPYACFALSVLALLNLLNYADRNVFVALVEPIKREFSLSDRNMGLLNFAFMLSFSLAAYPIARLSDRGVRKNIVAFGGLLWSLATLLTGSANSFRELFLCRAVLGVGEAAYACTLSPMLSDYFPLRLRATVISIAASALGMGTALGFFVGGIIYHHIGWRYAFYAFGLPGVVLAGLAYFLKEPVRGLAERTELKLPHLQEQFTAPRAADLLAPIREILAIPTIRWVCLTGILLTFSLGGLFFWLPSFLERYHGFSTADVAVKLSAAAGFGILGGMLCGGLLADFLQRKTKAGIAWVVLGGLVGTIPLSVILLVVDDPSSLHLIIFASAFLLMATIGPNAALIMNVVPLGLRATASALYLFLIHMLGDAISPAILGAVSDFAYDLRTAFFVIPVVLSLSAWTAYKIVRTYPDDAQRLETAIAGIH